MTGNASFHVDDRDWVELAGLAVSRAGYKPLTSDDYTGGAYSIELTRIAPGGSSNAHTEPWAHLFYVLDGDGEIEVDGARAAMRPGSVHPVSAGQIHSLANTGAGDLVMLAVYHPPRAR